MGRFNSLTVEPQGFRIVLVLSGKVGRWESGPAVQAHRKAERDDGSNEELNSDRAGYN